MNKQRKSHVYNVETILYPLFHFLKACDRVSKNNHPLNKHGKQWWAPFLSAALLCSWETKTAQVNNRGQEAPWSSSFGFCLRKCVYAGCSALKEKCQDEIDGNKGQNSRGLDLLYQRKSYIRGCGSGSEILVTTS